MCSSLWFLCSRWLNKVLPVAGLWGDGLLVRIIKINPASPAEVIYHHEMCESKGK